MLRQFFKKCICAITLVAFLLTSVAPSFAQSLILSAPGKMIGLTPATRPAILTGIKVYADEPFRLDFILDPGDRAGGESSRDGFMQDQSQRLIKYFLAALTVPEKDLWVNLSPYEQDRIISKEFGLTEMGRDLLAQDYVLKQITSSLMFPDGDIGKKFWAEIYQKANDMYGTTDIPIDTFNKVWIVPQKAVVYENLERHPERSEASPRDESSVAYIVESRLKVMLEADYTAMTHNATTILRQDVSQQDNTQGFVSARVVPGGDPFAQKNNIVKEVLRHVIIPALEREVNEGANFAQLRQVYQSLILAAWYKKKIKDSLLAKVYVDKNKVQGVNIEDPKEAEKIWERYVEAFKTGVFNMVKEERDLLTHEVIPRKYFSGGVSLDSAQLAPVMDIRNDRVTLRNVLGKFLSGFTGRSMMLLSVSLLGAGFSLAASDLNAATRLSIMPWLVAEIVGGGFFGLAGIISYFTEEQENYPRDLAVKLLSRYPLSRLAVPYYQRSLEKRLAQDKPIGKEMSTLVNLINDSGFSEEALVQFLDSFLLLPSLKRDSLEQALRERVENWDRRVRSKSRPVIVRWLLGRDQALSVLKQVSLVKFLALDAPAEAVAALRKIMIENEIRLPYQDKVTILDGISSIHHPHAMALLEEMALNEKLDNVAISKEIRFMAVEALVKDRPDEAVQALKGMISELVQNESDGQERSIQQMVPWDNEYQNAFLTLGGIHTREASEFLRQFIMADTVNGQRPYAAFFRIEAAAALGIQYPEEAVALLKGFLDGEMRKTNRRNEILRAIASFQGTQDSLKVLQEFVEQNRQDADFVVSALVAARRAPEAWMFFKNQDTMDETANLIANSLLEQGLFQFKEDFLQQIANDKKQHARVRLSAASIYCEKAVSNRAHLAHVFKEIAQGSFSNKARIDAAVRWMQAGYAKEGAAVLNAIADTGEEGEDLIAVAVQLSRDGLKGEAAGLLERVGHHTEKKQVRHHAAQLLVTSDLKKGLDVLLQGRQWADHDLVVNQLTEMLDGPYLKFDALTRSGQASSQSTMGYVFSVIDDDALEQMTSSELLVLVQALADFFKIGAGTCAILPFLLASRGTTITSKNVELVLKEITDLFMYWKNDPHLRDNLDDLFNLMIETGDDNALKLSRKKRVVLALEILESKVPKYVHLLEDILHLGTYSEKYRPMSDLIVNHQVDLDVRMSLAANYTEIMAMAELVRGMKSAFIGERQRRLREQRDLTMKNVYSLIEDCQKSASNKKWKKLLRRVSNDFNMLRKAYLEFMLDRDLTLQQQVLLDDPEVNARVVTIMSIMSVMTTQVAGWDFQEAGAVVNVMRRALNVFFSAAAEASGTDAVTRAAEEAMWTVLNLNKEGTASWRGDAGLKVSNVDVIFGNKEVILENKKPVKGLVNSGYKLDLLRQGMKINTFLSQSNNLVEKQKSIRQFIDEMVEIVTNLGVYIKIQDDALNFYEKASKYLLDAQEAFKKNKIRVPNNVNDRLSSIPVMIQRIEKSVSQDESPQEFTVMFKKGLLNEAAAGAGKNIPGCFNPKGGYNRMPLEHAVEANVGFLQVFDSKGDQVANAVVHLTEEGAFVEKGYSNGEYDTELGFARGIMELSRYIPKIYLAPSSAGFTTLQKYGKPISERVELFRFYTVFTEQYSDVGLPFQNNGILGRIFTLDPVVAPYPGPIEIAYAELESQGAFQDLMTVRGAPKVVNKTTSIDFNMLAQKMLKKDADGKDHRKFFPLVGYLKQKVLTLSKDENGKKVLVVDGQFRSWIVDVARKKNIGFNEQEIHTFTELFLDFLEDAQVEVIMAHGEAVHVNEPQKGGIDLDPTLMDLEILGTGRAMKFNISPAEFKRWNDAPGIVPVIMSIKFLSDPRPFLGADKRDDAFASG